MFEQLRNRIASAIAPKNIFNQSFFKYLGGQYSQYDTDGKVYLDKGFKTNPDVYSVIIQKATKHTKIPYGVKRVKDKKAKTKLDGMKYAHSPNDIANFLRTKALEKKAFSEDVLDFPMARPNKDQTWSQIWALYSTFMSLTGNFYLYMFRPEGGPNAGAPIQVFVLPSHLMKIVLKKDADMMEDASPVESYMLIEGQIYNTFPAEDVIHVKYANPDYDQLGSHLYGPSPIRAALRNIQSSNEAIDNNLKTMVNGGAFGFISGKSKALSQPQADEIKRRLTEMDADTTRLGKISGSSAELAFTRVSLTTDELKPFDFLQYDQDTICNVLNWESRLLNNSKTTPSSMAGRSEYEMAEKRALSKSVIPDNSLLEEALNDRFLPLFKGYEGAVFAFDYDDLPEMQPDMEILTKWLTSALNTGVITRDEFREAIRFPVMGTPEMQVFTVTDDIIPLSEAIATDFGTSKRSKDEPTDV